MKCLINGAPERVLDVADRGLHYGDGVFETLAVINRKTRYFDHHMLRLERGCAKLGIPAPARPVIEQEIARLCAEEDAGRAIVKVVVTRGRGERGYAPPVMPEPTRILLRYAWPAEREVSVESGVRVRICTMRLGINTILAGVKHLNRLEQVLARAEWTDEDIKEGLMFDQEDFLVEGVHSNVFLVIEGCLRTPLLDRCGVAGVMRERVLDLARRAGMKSQCCRLVREDLHRADEIFLTNTVSGIVPVSMIEDKAYPVGAITERLRELLAEDQAA